MPQSGWGAGILFLCELQTFSTLKAHYRLLTELLGWETSRCSWDLAGIDKPESLLWKLCRLIVPSSNGMIHFKLDCKIRDRYSLKAAHMHNLFICIWRANMTHYSAICVSNNFCKEVKIWLSSLQVYTMFVKKEICLCTTVRREVDIQQIYV
jgi:hypothetical protein